ncbi:hypothetical protein Tco_0300710 [Tanacetum coccineum]
MFRATSLLPIKSTDALIALEILKTHILYKPLTLTALVLEIYLQQFWYTVSENEDTHKCHLQLDNHWFEIGVDLLLTMPQLTQQQDNQSFIEPLAQTSLLSFIKALGYNEDDETPLKTISQVIVTKLHQPWRTILNILNRMNPSIRSPAERRNQARLPYTRFTKLIIDYLLSHNNTISKDHMRRCIIPSTMVNDAIKMMDGYKEHVDKNKRVVVLMVQPKLVDPIQGTHKKSRAGGVGKTMEKGPMIRGEELVERVKSFKTKIVLSTKKKPASKAKEVKEMYVDDPDQIHVATLLDRLTNSQTVDVPEVTITELTGPDQRGSIVVNLVMNLTPGETPTLGSIPGGNPELISCTSGASENASDVMAQNLNLQVQPITGVDDLIPYPPITTIITIKPTRFKRKKIMDEFIAEKVPTAVQESVSAQVINEVNNHAHILVPDVVADFIRPCLHKVVLHVHHTERISLTTTPTLSTTNITIPELKKKLYEMMPNNAKSTMLSTLLYENMCTNTNKLLQKCHTLTCRNEKVTGGE